MVSSIAPLGAALPVQAQRGYPTDRGAGAPGLHKKPGIGASPLDSIKQSATKAIDNLNSPIDIIPRTEMMREFLGIERNGAPAGRSDNGEGLCSAMSRTVREKFETALKSNGMIDRNMAKSDMIKLTLGLGPYARQQGASDMLSAAARIAQFCTGLMWQDSGMAMQSRNMGSRLDLLL